MSDYSRYTEAKVHYQDWAEAGTEEERRMFICQKIGKAAAELLYDITKDDTGMTPPRTIFLAVFKTPAIGDYERFTVAEVEV